MGKHVRRVPLLAFVLFLLSTHAAHAQWVFVARKGLQIIHSIASQAQGSGQAQSTGQNQAGGVDAATVMLEASADKVYSVAVKLVRENPDLQLLWQDDARQAIAFSRGDQSASLKVSSLNDNLCQILVASTYGQPGGTSLVVEGILRVCKQMGVECTHAQD